MCRAASCLSRKAAASGRLCASLRRNSAPDVESIDWILRIVSDLSGGCFKARDDLVLLEALALLAQSSSAMTPSRGATSAVCSFMLSIVTIVSPRFTVVADRLVHRDDRRPASAP